MSWWTGDGLVTLPKPVIDLLAEAALALREEIVEEIIHDNPDLHVEIGVPVFDSLEPKTQVFALAYVLRHLSDAGLASPELFAWNEGTAWAMFVKAGHELVMEIDLEADAEADTQFLFRRLIRHALKAVDPSARLRPFRSRNLDAWNGDLDEIAEHLLWDRDFLDEGTFADMHPPWLNPSSGGPGSTTTTSPRRRHW